MDGITPKARGPDRKFLKLLRRETTAARKLLQSHGGLERLLEERNRYIQEHGLTFPIKLDSIPPEKLLASATFFYSDCPLLLMETAWDAGPYNDGIMLLPNGCAKALVKIPESIRTSRMVYAHARSTLARLGVEITLDQREFQLLLKLHPLPPAIIVSVINWGHYPLLIRPGDTIVLSNLSDVLPAKGLLPLSTPRTTAHGKGLDLHAGEERLELIVEKLPSFPTAAEEKHPYIDPRARNLKETLRVTKFQRLDLEPNDFVVMSVRETIQIPEGNIGVVFSLRDELQHSSAKLVYPTWEGRLALEFKVWKRVTIHPGMLVAMLTTHQPKNFITPYAGRYKHQQSIAPKTPTSI